MLTDAAKISSHFVSQFHHAMPISAYGQTTVHDRLGFDHRNAVDVAVSPDSAEGQTLMAYLRSVGIPFIAFRHAVGGLGYGARIHIGYPSRADARIERFTPVVNCLVRERPPNDHHSPPLPAPAAAIGCLAAYCVDPALHQLLNKSGW